jgi:hypothetical protein
VSNFYCSPCNAYSPADCSHEETQETFTGLTLDDINRVVNHHFVRGRADGRKAGYREGYTHGAAGARDDAQQQAEKFAQWVWVNIVRPVQAAEERVDKFRIAATRLSNAQNDELRLIEVALGRVLNAWERRETPASGRQQ